MCRGLKKISLYPRSVFLLLVLLLAQSCAQTKLNQNLSIAYHPEFGEKPLLTSKEEIFKIDVNNKERFLDYLKTNSNKSMTKNLLTANYIKALIQEFSYHDDTLTLSESLSRQEGNCLSLAILTTGLSRLAGVNVTYEIVETPHLYRKKGGVIFDIQHIVSLLHEPISKQETYRFTPSSIIKIDFFPEENSYVLERVNQETLIAMYFQNKTANALAEQRYKDAYWLARESLEYSPGNVDSLNMLALIYEKMKFNLDAESTYQYAMQLSPNAVDILINYHKFLVRNEQQEKALLIRSRIDRIGIVNPFDWIRNGDKALEKGEYNLAIKHYNKVIELTPYLHQAHFGLAQAHLLKGNTKKAQIALVHAIQHADDNEALHLYQSELIGMIQ